MKSEKLNLITTIVLAVTAVITTGLAVYGISQTQRTVGSQEQALQTDLLIQRYQALHEAMDEHQDTFDANFRQHIYDLAEQTAGAPTGFELVNDESLCSTLGSYEWVCTNYHEYSRVWDDSMAIEFAFLRSLQLRDLELAAEELDALEDNMNELDRLYREVFFPGTL